MKPLPEVWAALAALLATATLAATGRWLFGSGDSPGRRAWRAYGRWVEESLRPLFLRRTPAQYAARHFGGALAAALLLGLAGGAFFGFLFLAGAIAAGFLWPRYARVKRLARLEAQIDPTLRSLAQTIRVTANIVDAFETAARQLDAPMKDEIDLLVRQHRLGMTVEDALREMGARAGSRNLDAAVTALVIGRLTGGNLPDILEEIASVLRERMRLEAFIDAKTAEGKAQAWIMGSMPVVAGGLVYLIDPTFMMPMFRDPLGWMILAAIVVLIAAGVYWVRRVSTVDV